MSIKIEIGVGCDVGDPKGYLDLYMSALGFTRGAILGAGVAAEPRKIGSAPELAMGYGNDVEKIVTNTPRAGESDEQTEARTKRSRKKADDKPANISTNPEDRRPPEDDAEIQAQDAADEQAEVEAAREPEKAITVDDLRGVMGEYVQKFEMPATQEDGPLIFADALGKPPAGEAAWKLSLLAELPQERLKAAYDGWRTAVDSGKRYQKRG